MQMSEVVLCHRPPHFQHIFRRPLCSRLQLSVVRGADADAFNAFEEIWRCVRCRDRQTAARPHLRAGARATLEAYQAFRGRMPAVDPMFRKRGLIAESA
jgi:Zn-dependent oligopeptidase